MDEKDKIIMFQRNFDRIFQEKGGRLPDTERNLQLDFCLDSIKSNIEQSNNLYKKNLSIYVDYIKNESINAGVTKYDGVYYIGVFHGGIFVLCNLFLRMLSNPNILKTYGDPINEKTTKIFNAQITNVRDLYLATTAEENIIPINEDRKNVALLLIQFALQNLALHECGHIFNGHTDYKVKKFKESTYFELNDSLESKSLVEPLFQQCLELEADAFSVNIALLNLLSGAVTYGSQRKIIIKKEDNEKKIFLWYFAVYAHWRLYGMNRIDSDEIKSRTHPSSAFRQHIVRELIKSIINKNKVVLTESILKILDDSIIEVEKAFNEISEQVLNISNYASVLTKEMDDHYNVLKQITIKEVYPLLKEFRYFKL